MGDYFKEEMRNQKEALESISSERRLKKQMGIRHKPPKKISKLGGGSNWGGKRSRGLGEATTAAPGELRGLSSLQALARVSTSNIKDNHFQKEGEEKKKKWGGWVEKHQRKGNKAGDSKFFLESFSP